MCNQSQALEILQSAYEQSKAVFGAAMGEAFLYGSYARGDFTVESDIDILLIVNRTGDYIASQRKKMAEITSNLSLQYDITVSITVKSAQQFDAHRHVLPFYKNVLKEGIRYAG